MIYGDPFYFSLQFDVVAEWSEPDDIWKNGLFSICIEGNILFNAVDVFELTTTFSFYARAPIEYLNVNDDSADANTIYSNAENYFKGDGEMLIDGLFDMTCTPMEDNGFSLYFIKTSVGDRLIWSTDYGNKIHEKILPPGTVHGVINKLRENPL